MRSHFILLTAAVLSTHAVQQGVAAAPILGPLSTQDSGLKILDDTLDPLVSADVAGALMTLEEGHLLDLDGIMRAGSELLGGIGAEVCVDLVVGGITQKKCHRKGKGRSHSRPWRGDDAGSRSDKDDWSKEEHARCSAHFREWHRGKHGVNNYREKYERAQATIRDLQRQLKERENCARPGKSLAVKPNKSKADDGSAGGWQSPNIDNPEDWQPDNQKWQSKPEWSPSSPEPTHPHVKHLAHHGQQDGSATSTSTSSQYTPTCATKAQFNPDGSIRVKACVEANLDLPLDSNVHAKADADVKVDPLKGKVDAKANVEAGAKVANVAEVKAKTNVDAKADLSKGDVNAKVSQDVNLKVGNTEVVDSTVIAGVQSPKNGKDCPSGTVVNALGFCVELGLKKNDSQPSTSDVEQSAQPGLIGLGGILRRVA